MALSCTSCIRLDCYLLRNSVVVVTIDDDIDVVTIFAGGWPQCYTAVLLLLATAKASSVPYMYLEGYYIA